MQRFIDLLLPPRCPACGTEATPLCRPCAAVLERRLAEPAGTSLGLPSDQPAGLVQLEWCAAFSGPARQAVHALKYDGERRLAPSLAGLMADRWRRAGAGGEALVPVPVHAERRRQRGFDQAELLAVAMGRELQLPVERALRRASATVAQHALGRRARAGNVGRAFEVPDAYRPAVTGRWLVLVDDVVTTGATLAACAAALQDAGAAAVSAICLAREH